jgi:predicted phage tail component-like protein
LYQFRDINQSKTDNKLSSESFTYDGVYFENVIEGYKTLKVTGRESFQKEINSEVIGQADGEFYNYSRVAKRDIAITFQLKAKTPNDLMNKFTQLNKLLKKDNARLIFADENDKYFNATFVQMENVTEGTLMLTGTMLFTCLDPYKYDVNAKTKTLPTGQNFIEVTNEGTAPTFLDVRAEMLSDNGFIGVVTDDRYFQQGNPYENDLASRTRSETLLNANHWQGGTTTISGVTPRVNSNAYLGKAYQNFYALNQQPYIKHMPATDYATQPNGQGIIHMKAMNVLTIQNNFNDNVTGAQEYQGTGLSWEIPADSQGAKGAVNFRLLFALWFETGFITQASYIQVSCLDGNNNTMASIEFVKDTINNNNANMIIKYYSTDPSYSSNLFKEVRNIPFQPTYWNNLTNAKLYGYSIEKKGADFTVNYPTGSVSFTSNNFKDVPCKHISVFIGRKAPLNNANMLTHRYITDMIFIKDNVNYTEDVPNFFYNGSVWELDSSKNETRINGTPNNVMRDIGSQPIVIPTGTSKVYFGVSNFATMPNITVSYRQKYL